MTFKEALRDFHSGLFRFQGRAGRSEFWWKHLIFAVAATASLCIGVLIARLLSGGGPVEGLVLLPPLLAFIWANAWAICYGIPLAVRRTRDTGVSGWWMIPIVVCPLLLGLQPETMAASVVLSLICNIYVSLAPSAPMEEEGGEMVINGNSGL